MDKIIAACGNDCSICPRYTMEPYTKTDEDLRHTAELWHKIGYRDRIETIDEIKCSGCNIDNWCRYGIVSCVEGRQLDNCGECKDYPCNTIKECFEITKEFEPMCKKFCNKEEYEIMRKAFFEKKLNLEIK